MPKMRLLRARTVLASFNFQLRRRRSIRIFQLSITLSKVGGLTAGLAHSLTSHSGIFFPPDHNGLLKLCSCRFITNYYNSSVPGASLGHSHEDFPADGIPRVIEEEMREFMRELIPELADRPWTTTRMCWDGDTKDINFRICPSPSNSNLFIATAGSGHGFKFLPIIGDYVVDMLEGKLASEYCELWKWRFGATPPKTGNEPHPFPERDLGQLDGWRGRNARL